jgi:hypothetical protein
MDKGRIARWLLPKKLKFSFQKRRQPSLLRRWWGTHLEDPGRAGAAGGGAAPRITWAMEAEEPCGAWLHRPRPLGRRGGRAGRGRPTRPARRGGVSMAFCGRAKLTAKRCRRSMRRVCPHDRGRRRGSFGRAGLHGGDADLGCRGGAYGGGLEAGGAEDGGGGRRER